jgi:uncharacterized protein DUF3823
MIVKPLASDPASLVLTLGMVLSGCGFGELDNYAAPNATLMGRVVYQGTPVGVRSNGVQLELWQPGYDLNQKIPIHIAQDGSFSARIFDGDYRLNLLPGNGPWVDNRDTIPIQVRGRAEVDVPVVPYYTIENPAIGDSSGSVQATFTVRSVTTTRDVEYVGLYVSTTTFVDRTNMVVRTERARSDIPALDAPIVLSVTLPANLAQRNDVYARIGVKTVGVDELLFSPIQRIPL